MLCSCPYQNVDTQSCFPSHGCGTSETTSRTPPNHGMGSSFGTPSPRDCFSAVTQCIYHQQSPPVPAIVGQLCGVHNIRAVRTCLGVHHHMDPYTWMRCNETWISIECKALCHAVDEKFQGWTVVTRFGGAIGARE